MSTQRRNRCPQHLRRPVPRRLQLVLRRPDLCLRSHQAPRRGHRRRVMRSRVPSHNLPSQRRYLLPRRNGCTRIRPANGFTCPRTVGSGCLRGPTASLSRECRTSTSTPLRLGGPGTFRRGVGVRIATAYGFATRSFLAVGAAPGLPIRTSSCISGIAVTDDERPRPITRMPSTLHEKDRPAVAAAGLQPCRVHVPILG